MSRRVVRRIHEIFPLAQSGRTSLLIRATTIEKEYASSPLASSLVIVSFFNRSIFVEYIDWSILVFIQIPLLNQGWGCQNNISIIYIRNRRKFIVLFSRRLSIYSPSNTRYFCSLNSWTVPFSANPSFIVPFMIITFTDRRYPRIVQDLVKWLYKMCIKW